jgi:hypothetical protein
VDQLEEMFLAYAMGLIKARPGTGGRRAQRRRRHPAGGRWRRVAVHPFRLRAPFSELLEVRQYQVVHEPARLLVKVALRDTAPADTPARVRDALARELRDAGAVPPPIKVTVVPGIDRDPGHGAKFKLIKSTMPRI